MKLNVFPRMMDMKPEDDCSLSILFSCARLHLRCELPFLIATASVVIGCYTGRDAPRAKHTQLCMHRTVGGE